MKFTQRNKIVGVTIWLIVLVSGTTLFVSAQNTVSTAPTQAEKLATAEKLFSEARNLARQDTMETLRASLTKLEDAKRIYSETGEKKNEAYCLVWLGDVNNYLGEKQKALEYYNQALPIWRTFNDKSNEVITLNNIGNVYSDLGKKRKALDYYIQTLPLRKAIGDSGAEYATLINIGYFYSNFGESQKALDYYNQALDLSRTIKNKSVESTTLNIIGGVYSILGDKQKALGFYNQALSLVKLIGDKVNEVTTLTNIGVIHSDLGDKQKALEIYTQSLAIAKTLNDKIYEVNTLISIGQTYSDLGEFEKSLNYYNQILKILKTSGNKKDIADTLARIGIVYFELGDKQKSLEYFNQSLSLARTIGDNGLIFVSLSGIGNVYFALGEMQKAVEYFTQATTACSNTGDKRCEAATQSLLGLVYSFLGDKEKSLDYLKRASITFENVNDKNLEAMNLSMFGSVYLRLGENQKAIEFSNLALPKLRSTNAKNVEVRTLYNLMYAWDFLNNPHFAIYYGKQAVNIFQELRSNVTSLDKEIQKTYFKSVESSYRDLADILIAQERIAEAEQVLGMLKEDEYFSYLRRSKEVAAELKERISLSPDEKKAFEDYEKYADEITKTAQDFYALKKKKNDLPLGETLSAEDQKRYDELEAKYNAAVTVFNKFLDDLKVRFAQKGEQFNQVAAVESVTKQLLKKLDQPRTVIISTIVGEDRLNLIVTTAGIQKAHTVDISSNDLNKLVVEFRDAVKNPSVDPRPLGKQLYDKLFPAELQKDLANIKADTIVWSLDGTLRYVPMAALWDGEKYLVERYNNAILTLAAIQNIEAKANPNRQNWQVFGVGVSKPFEKFSALPAVPQELCSVVENPQKKEFCKTYGKTGVFGGLMRLDEEFTKEDFTNNIGKKQVAIVHIASHFDLNAGDYKDSYLLLGGGEDRRFSLEDLRGKEDLGNIELLTLSACNTAMTSGVNSSGVEVEGFGTLAQKQGAKTVLATLWAVADDSTGELMTEFYRILEDNPKIGKAEALRTAQIKMIGGEYKTSEEAAKKRSDLINLSGESANQPKFETDKNAPFAHPYFWSPFVLIGNWR